MTAALIGPADPELVALEARLRRAQLDADVKALDDLIADDLLFTGPDGELSTKQHDLEAHATGAVRFRRHEPEALQLRRVGNAVVLAAMRATLTVEVGGVVVTGTFRYTRIWARDAEASWRVVGGHVSML